ncbi:MAG: hypothetical protein ABIS08_03910 [Pseudolysinimonas sp.]
MILKSHLLGVDGWLVVAGPSGILAPAAAGPVVPTLVRPVEIDDLLAEPPSAAGGGTEPVAQRGANSDEFAVVLPGTLIDLGGGTIFTVRED